jgi:hypothetical protein
MRAPHSRIPRSISHFTEGGKAAELSASYVTRFDVRRLANVMALKVVLSVPSIEIAPMMTTEMSAEIPK